MSISQKAAISLPLLSKFFQIFSDNYFIALPVYVMPQMKVVALYALTEWRYMKKA